MAAAFLYDLSTLDLNRIITPIEDIRKINPHRFEMEQLSGIIHVDMPSATVVGVKYVTMDEFWVRGHIPGRPLMPGVIILEAAAQLCSYMTHVVFPDMGFLGFVKADNTRFRGSVLPPGTLYLIAKLVTMSRRRVIAQCQGICNNTLIFESEITGMPV